MKHVARLLLLVTVAYLLISLGMYVAQNRLVYLPSGYSEPLQAGDVITDEGIAILWMKAEDPQAVTVVHFHGNASQIVRETYLGHAVNAAGGAFAAVEYPGYGLLEGEPGEAAILSAARASLDLLVRRGVPRDRIVLSGQSLGTGVAMAMAAEGWRCWWPMPRVWRRMRRVCRRVRCCSGRVCGWRLCPGWPCRCRRCRR